MAAIALLAANCSPQNKVASSQGGTIDPRYGVAASPRVVEDGQAVPKGGGREMVGRPYQVAGRTYVPRENPSYSRVGLASWYGAAFHGRLTANGEVFDRHSIGAAHTTMPLPSYARVTNTQNNRSMIVRVNDRGPYHANRLIDVSEKVAEALDFRRAGTARVKVDYIGRASTRGSDDRKLLATLTTDGRPASFPGVTAPVMVASLEPASAVAPNLRSVFGAPRPAEDDAAPRALAQAPVLAPAAEQQAARSSVLPPAAPRLVANVPLPPERPFDFGRPSGSSRKLAQLPASRPVVAGMFYAEPATPRDDPPFAALKTDRVLPLKRL